MATKERYQNPVVGDTVNLRLFTYNSNNRANLNDVEKVEIYFLDPENKTESNPDGRRLIETVTTISRTEVGQYVISVVLNDLEYVIGDYVDVWTFVVESGETATTTENNFKVHPDLWYVSSSPIVYDFSFKFQPNRLRSGEKRFLIVQIKPNVTHAPELEAYYTNLAIVSPLTISIEQECVDCMPAEQDLRLEVDAESIDYRETNLGYYFLDTSEDGLDLAKGIYNVWFEMDFGESTYISEKSQLQIF